MTHTIYLKYEFLFDFKQEILQLSTLWPEKGGVYLHLTVICFR